MQTISEAVSLEWVALPDGFFDLPPLKIDTAGLEKRIQIAEFNNNKEYADLARKQLAKWKAIIESNNK